MTIDEVYIMGKIRGLMTANRLAGRFDPNRSHNLMDLIGSEISRMKALGADGRATERKFDDRQSSIRESASEAT